MSRQIPPRTLSPATIEIIHYALAAAASEMMVNVKRAAYSPSIHEIQDVCVGLVNCSGDILACAPGLPMFISDVGEVVRDGLELLGRKAFRPGDVYASNDPFTIGSHINNVATYMPIFHQGELLAFSVVRGHMVDLGGAVPGSRSSRLTEIYQEGLRLRQVKLYAEGEPLKEMLRVIGDNCRIPEAVLGDLRAQVAACRTGEQRLLELVRRYGGKVLDEACRVIIDQGEQAARAGVKAIPDGEYQAQAYLDDDGLATGENVAIRVKVKVVGDEMTIDFTDFADQVAGSINTGRSGAIAIARYAFKCLTTPQEPVNEGHFRPLHVVIPDGKVISALPPAACGWWSRTTSTTLDVIFRALSDAIPESIPAGHFGDIPMCLMNGWDREGSRYVFFEPVPGGHGGRPHEDGVSATVCFHEGDTPDVPAEIQEALYPVLIEESALDQDSAGPGRYRGGLGYRRTMRILSDNTSLQLNVDRHQCLPWGLWGGLPAQPNRAYVRTAGSSGWEMMLKVDGLRLPADSQVRLIGGGGGGWGDPNERDPEQVRRDVLAGYVSLAAAQRDYHVVLRQPDWEIDDVATKELRKTS